MFISSFDIKNKLGRAQIFQKMFLLAKNSKEMVFDILVFTFSNIEIKFANQELTWKIYTAKETLSKT